MAVITRSEMQTRAETIRTATVRKENTAERVGQLLKDAADSLAFGASGGGTDGPNLTNANETLLVSQGTNRAMLNATATAIRVKTLSRTGATSSSEIAIDNQSTTYAITVVDGGDSNNSVTVAPLTRVRFGFDGFVWGQK